MQSPTNESSNQLNSIFNQNSMAMSKLMTTSTGITTGVLNDLSNKNLTNQNADIQAQFELSIELRRFINIDLFQRGYYQIRLAVKCANKQIQSKISVQLENNANNNNLSDVMFPSCVIDQYAVSKTFLILYRNEEIILDDHILFKISAIVNAFNLIESFEKLDLQLSVELWFTESEYKPLSSLLASMSSSNMNANGNANGNSPATSTNNPNSEMNSNGMQQLCCRTFKIKFDPRQGIHLQVPVLFDYFHLSAVLTTIHCSLLTLLPPVMLGSNVQRNLTIASILFGKDLSQFKNIQEINEDLMKRAVFLHNQICGLLLSAYEHLQDHINKLLVHLNEFERKKIVIEKVDCQEKLRKLCEIIQQCKDADILDDMANRNVAQCSAENIMQWCLYVDNFTFNQTISPYLALEYHNKRLKRFSESFFTKDISKKHIQEGDTSEHYATLNDQIRQSAYFQLMPDLIVSCDELDGVAESMPVIFEDNYVSYPTHAHQNGFSFSRGSLMKKSNRSYSTNSNNNFSVERQSNSSNETGGFHGNLLDSSKQLHKKMKKKLANFDSIDSINTNKSITLVSYKKMNDHFHEQVSISQQSSVDDTVTIRSVQSPTPSSTTTTGYGSVTTSNSDLNTQSKLSMIKAELTKSLSSSSSSSPSIASIKQTNSSNATSHKQLNETNVDVNVTTNTISASDLLFGQSFNERAIDVAELSNGVDQIDISMNSLTPTEDNKSLNRVNSNVSTQETPRNTTTTPTDFISPTSAVSASAAQPTDCSIKSRALYESFRGKLNTLERPRYPRDYMKSRNRSTSSNEELVLSRLKHSNKLNRNKSIDDEREKVFSSANELTSSDAARKHQYTNETPLLSLKSYSLQKQISSNNLCDAQKSLSTVLNDGLYKFVMAKEEIKRVLGLKYHGNIYSEFSSFFCTAPYFYNELTPKLTPSHSFLNTEKNKVTPSKFSRSSFMSSIRSKSKLLKIFNKSNTDDNSTDKSITSDDLDAKENMVENGGQDEANEEEDEEEKVHLVVCVHGLEGNSGDLRLIRTYLELALPGAKLDFLMSEQNQENTFDDIEVMTKQLIKEINDHIESYGIEPGRISFIGHSLGNLIIRSTVCHENFKPLASKLYTFLSLSGPHLGTMYNSSGLVNMGLWLMQKWKKSPSLLQLGLKDNSDIYNTFLYKLSKKATLSCFKHVLIVASPQDRYAPYHSARIEMCKAAYKDTQFGPVYKEMVMNILKPIQDNPNITFKRYSAFYALPGGTSSLIGRAAHVAVLDSEIFVEKLILISVAKYFR